MVGSFPRGLRSIVAAYAIPGDPRVIEPRTCERIGRVAILALVAGFGMVRGLSHGADTVMAAHAALGGACVIEPRDRPLAGGMAAIALGLGDDMVGGLAIGTNVVVTARAFSRGALEYGTLMAGFASNGHMRARQWKASGEMIEIGLASSRRGTTGDNRHRDHRCQERQKPSPYHV